MFCLPVISVSRETLDIPWYSVLCILCSLCSACRNSLLNMSYFPIFCFLLKYVFRFSVLYIELPQTPYWTPLMVLFYKKFYKLQLLLQKIYVIDLQQMPQQVSAPSSILLAFSWFSLLVLHYQYHMNNLIRSLLNLQLNCLKLGF